MNKKAIGMFYTLMLGVTIIILGLALAKPAKDFKDSAMNETTIYGTQGLNCSNPDINKYDKSACYAIDITYYLSVGGIILLGLGVIGAKIVWG